MAVPEILVTRTNEAQFQVTVKERGSQTEHRVSASADMVEEFGGGVEAEHLIAASFRFLLEREPKEQILRVFALSDIQRYFPEYRAAIRSYLSRPS